MADDQKLSRQRRITKRKDFLRIQANGRRTRSEHLLLITAPAVKELSDGGLPPPRLGITITTKIDKRAARRNRLKRRIRELFRRERVHLVPARDLVVIALTGAAELGFDEVKEELLFLFNKARLYSRRQTPRP